MTRWRRRLTRTLLALAALALIAAAAATLATRRFEPGDVLTRARALTASPTPLGAALRSGVERGRLEADVAWLAHPDREGRENGSRGGRAARDWLVERLQLLGLEPAFGASYLQEIGDAHGSNVAGRLRAADSDAEAVVLVAHYDHVGFEGGELHPGADDNASGVAAGLEVARLLATATWSPRHDVVFLFADAEEPPDVRTATMGSTVFVAANPYGPARLRLAVVLDVMAGSPLPADPDRFFAFGAETSDAVARLVVETPQPAAHARCELASTALIEAEPYLPWRRRSKSDYHGFREAGRPFLFLTSGPTARYHTPNDTADSLRYDKLAAEVGFVADLLARAALDDEALGFSPDRVDPGADLDSVAELQELLLAAPEAIDESVLDAVRADRTALAELRATFAEAGRLSRFEYRRLTLMSLRVQCAMTRPGWAACGRF